MDDLKERATAALNWKSVGADTKQIIRELLEIVGRDNPMKHHKYEGRAPKETGTRRDVKGVPGQHSGKDGRHPHMQGPHHEMGEYKEGTHHHDHGRDKE